MLGTLEKEQPSQGRLTYKADAPAAQNGNDTEELRFDYTFEKEAYIVGYSTAVLYVVADDHDDMDIFIQLRKADRDGKLLEQINIPPGALGMSESTVPNVNVLKYLGPPAIIRASHRELDEKLSQPHHPVLAHRKLQKVNRGEVTRLEVGFWPGGMAFYPGERLAVKISGHEMRFAEFPALYGAFRSINVGHHVVYCGDSGYASSVEIPFVEL